MLLVDNMCWDCYKTRNRLISVPRDLIMEFCSVCGSYKLHGTWVMSNKVEDALLASAMDFVEKYVKLNGVGVFSVSEARRIGRGKISVLVRAHGSVNVNIPDYDEELWVEISIKRTVCPKCSRLASGVFSSIVQVRADGRMLSDHEIKCIDEIVRNILFREFGRGGSSNYKVEYVRGGLDYKFDSFRLARKVADSIRINFGAFIKESHKVIGFNGSKGSKISRLSISVRLPKFTFGDILNFNGRILRYDGFKNGKFSFYDLNSNSHFSVNYKDGWSKKIDILYRWDELPEGLIESVSDNLVEISNSIGEVFQAYKPIAFNVKCGDHVKFMVVDGKIIIISKVETFKH